jgi:uncharacterized protein YjbI with pentapeptide repeats
MPARSALSGPFALSGFPLSGFALAAGLALAGCDSTAGDQDDSPGFHYQAATGRCVDAQGKTGLNAYDSAAIFLSKHAECVALDGVNLTLLENHTPTFTEDSLKAWDFRGARFDGSDLHFYNITAADLRGADLSKLEYGYATVDGTVDAFTKAPSHDCELKDSHLHCVD